MPLVGLSFLLEEMTERVFIGFSAALALFGLLPAYFREHRKIRAVLAAFSGIVLITLTHFLFEENLIAKFVFLTAGAILISAAHYINRRLCHACAVCADAG